MFLPGDGHFHFFCDHLCNLALQRDRIAQLAVVSDQKCSSVAPRINWAVTRMCEPSRMTEPSTIASTPSFFAISGTEICGFLNRMSEVWEITSRSRIEATRPMRASVMPSAR